MIFKINESGNMPFVPTGQTEIQRSGNYDSEIQDWKHDEVMTTKFGTPMYFPVSLKKIITEPGEAAPEWFTLPLEPQVSVYRKKIIVKRKPRKAYKLKGTIKEVWSTDDWEITIIGILISENIEFPRDDFKRLQELAESVYVEVKGKMFEMLNIHTLAIENIEFPFTKGIENQAYKITAYSDDMQLNRSEQDLGIVLAHKEPTNDR